MPQLLTDIKALQWVLGSQKHLKKNRLQIRIAHINTIDSNDIQIPSLAMGSKDFYQETDNNDRVD